MARLSAGYGGLTHRADHSRCTSSCSIFCCSHIVRDCKQHTPASVAVLMHFRSSVRTMSGESYSQPTAAVATDRCTSHPCHHVTATVCRKGPAPPHPQK